MFRLKGAELAVLLTDWFQGVVPPERAFGVMSERPPDEEWRSFIDARDGLLDRQLMEISHMDTVDEMAKRVMTWNDDLLLALISRLGDHTRALRREYADRVILRGPDPQSREALYGAAIRLTLLAPTS